MEKKYLLLGKGKNIAQTALIDGNYFVVSVCFTFYNYSCCHYHSNNNDNNTTITVLVIKQYN